MTTHTISPGHQARADANVNIRRSPGYKNKPGNDRLGVMTKGALATVLAGPEDADGLTWWQIRSKLAGGDTVEGWAAEKAPSGKTLLRRPGTPPVQRVGPSAFVVGESVTNVARKPINLRCGPGFANKPDDDVVNKLPVGTGLTLLNGPQYADGLEWWQVRASMAGGESTKGWVCVAGDGGRRFLAPTTFAGGIVVHQPFRDDYRVTQWWGENPGFYHRFRYDGVRLRGHNGIDFGIPVGVPLLAVSAGVVRRVGFEKGGFGNFILLNHRWGESLYAHLKSIKVKRGQQVAQGEAIGQSGNTGASTGPHLHFGIRIHPYRRTDGWGGFADPEPFMAPETFDTVSFAVIEDDVEPTPMGDEDPNNPRP